MARPFTKRYPYHGEMLTIPEIAERCGLSRNTVKSRCERGIPVDSPLQHRQKAGLYPYEGEMLTLPEISKRTGISRQTLRNRILVMGLPVEEAVKKGRFHHGTSKVVYNCSEERKEMILKEWNRGEKTVAEVVAATGFPEAVVGMVLPIRELDADEAKAKREVLRRYGYGR